MRCLAFTLLVGCQPTTMPAIDAQQHGFIRAWGQLGDETGSFHFPIGIAIDGEDVLHITDYRNARIERFDTDGTFLSSTPVDPYPGAIAIDRSTNELYITHFAAFSATDPLFTDKVTVHDLAGTELREFGRTGQADGELWFPGGIAIGTDGRVYVADQQNHRVEVFDRDGTYRSRWGTYGPDLGQFGNPGTQNSRVAGPNFLAIVPSSGDILTTEGSVGRVQRFSAEGQSIDGWGGMADAPGQFGGSPYNLGPLSIAVDRSDHVWVSALSGRIQQFDVDGTFLQGFGAAGSAESEFQVPHGMAFDSTGALYVVDGLNHRVQKFGVE